MSLQLFFDDTLIDEQYYAGLTNNFELFNESFKLGSTPSNIYKLTVAKEGIETQPTSILLKDNGNTFAELVVDNIEEKDNMHYEYTLTDKMLDLDFYYDASEIFQNGSTTLYNIVMDICAKVGLILGTTNFRGYDKVINWYDNTRTAREYIGFIAELNGGFARIENNTLYFRKQKTNSVSTINIDNCEDFNVGEYHKITRVVYELGALKYEFGDETGNTLYLNSDNVYITEESEVQAIYNDIVNFEFYSFSTKNCPIDYNVKAGDIITFDDGINEYPTIAQYDLEYYGGWIGGYNLSINTERQEETKIIGEKDRIRDIKIIVDRQNNTISQVISEVDEQNTKISETQQTVNELNSKIQDIADITTQAETIYASLSFTGINQSGPIEVKIHPTTTNISYLYPRNNLYPSDILYMPNRVLRFTNTDTSEVFDYELPDDLLINSNTGTYDEFYLGYDEQICQVTKRCEYNADGSVSVLANEVINTYTYPSILLTDGDYTVELLGYNNGYMSVRLMAQNIYTTQFATKAELSSSITQTANEINLRVDEKLDEEDFTSANIMLKINNDQSSATIQADKINLNGAVTANNNFKINTDGTMEAVGGKFLGFSKNQSGYTPSIELQTPGPGTSHVYLYGDYIALVDGENLQLKWANMETSSDYIGLSAVNYKNNENTEIIIRAFDNGRSLLAVRGNTDVDGDNYILTTNIDGGVVNTYYVEYYVLRQRSEEKNKKNIVKLKDGLKKVLNTDIYEYNFNFENNNTKKHIGLVIGDKYNSAKELISNDDKSVDLYSMISVAYKAIQEQQEQIEQLQKEIKELKGEK